MSKEEETSSECVTYTVHISPTPDQKPLSTSQTNLQEEEGKNRATSLISRTIFTSGFNSVTRGHVIECSMEGVYDPHVKKPGLICAMKGCDKKAMKGRCGESYKCVSDEEENEEGEEEEQESEAED
ncbi:hypothetical protein RJT34_12325 [Clitoria ternatea]|uniref:Uncharacterized protein n=1 Tax=Clitoria ternatea TaxID=43366 RepID=A0AAN9PKD4_CLITE